MALLVGGWRICRGWRRLFMLLNSWLDRDLGISGRLSVRVGNTIDHRLVRIDEPILRVPQMAIHLADRQKWHHVPEGVATFERTPG